MKEYLQHFTSPNLPDQTAELDSYLQQQLENNWIEESTADRCRQVWNILFNAMGQTLCLPDIWAEGSGHLFLEWTSDEHIIQLDLSDDSCHYANVYYVNRFTKERLTKGYTLEQLKAL